MKDFFEGTTGPDQTHQGARYPELVQLLASVGVPLGKTRLTEAARRAGLRAAGARVYNADLVTADQQHAIALGQVKRVDQGCVRRGTGTQPFARRSSVGALPGGVRW